MEKNIEFRFFSSPHSKIGFRKLLKWNKIESTVDKKIISIEAFPTIFKFVNNEDKISFVMYTLRPYVTHNSAFIKSEVMAHITYRKNTKKMYIKNLPTLTSSIPKKREAYNIWTNSSVNFLKILGVEALNDNGKYDITNYLTKVTAKAILTGHCTSFADLTKRYYSSIGIKNISKKRAVLLHGNFHHNKQYLRVAKNKENLFKYIKSRGKKQLVRDTVDMAFTLQRKIDFKWSEKRFKAEHDKMQKEILEIRLKYMPNVIVDYRNLTFPKIDGITLLDSSHILLQESSIMHHCVGTSNNYLNQAQAYNSILLSYNRLGFRGTAEIGIDGRPFRIKQFKGFENTKPSHEAYSDLLNLLESGPLLDFINEVKSLTSKTYKDTLIHLPSDNISQFFDDVGEVENVIERGLDVNNIFKIPDTETQVANYDDLPF